MEAADADLFQGLPVLARPIPPATPLPLFQYISTVRFCVSQKDGQEARIDIDLPSSFFSQFPEMKDSPVPRELDERMIPLLQKIAS